VIEHIRRLREFYGLLPPPPGELFQFLLWEILSRESIPARRDLSWRALHRIPALTPDAVFRAPARDLLDAIGLAGPHREDRLETIRAVVGEFRRHRDELAAACVARTTLRRAVRSLRRLTAISVGVQHQALLHAGGFPIIPVDDDVARVINRLSGEEPIAPARRREPGGARRAQRRARHWLARHLPQDLETRRVALLFLRHHAHHTCTAAGPHCSVCPLRESCVAGHAAVAPIPPGIDANGMRVS
jgi:endonuclease III